MAMTSYDLIYFIRCGWFIQSGKVLKLGFQHVVVVSYAMSLEPYLKNIRK